MRHILILSIFAICFNSIVAQDNLDYSPCGTVPFSTNFTRAYKESPESFKKATDTVLYIPISIHVVGNDQGDGYFGSEFIYESLCQVNIDFEPSEIQFFIEGDFNYINRDSYYIHSTVLTGANMMFEYNVNNTINCYIVSDPAGACGYNLPYAGIAMNTSCMGRGDHTWSHELGHGLSVQHPFLGWEGNPYMAGTNAPEKVTYNYTYFKDTLIIDTLIIDTAFTELVDGSNCNIAADKHCMTSPDFIAIRWNCNENGQSPNIMLDYNGDSFRADGTLIMSYANDECQSRFTDDEIDRMRANIFEEKSSYLYNQSEPEILDVFDLYMSPSNEEVVDKKNVILRWGSVDSATEYLIKFGLGPFYSAGRSLAVKDTFLVVEDYNFFEGPLYYYKVTPVNKHYFCADARVESFRPETLSNIIETELGVIINKNLFSFGDELVIRNPYHRNLVYKIVNNIGQQIFISDVSTESFISKKMNYTDGMYYLILSDGVNNRIEKLIVH